MPEKTEVSNIIEIKNKEQFQNEINSDKLIIVDFWAEWCGPCRMMLPVLHWIANDNKEIKLLTINVEECWDLATEYDINSIPAIFFFKNWQIVDNFTWALPPDEILNKINLLSSNSEINPE